MAEKQKKDPAFEDLLAEAEDLARKMEQGGITLDESITAYSRGMDLLAKCAEKLRAAEEQIKILEEQNDALRLADPPDQLLEGIR